MTLLSPLKINSAKGKEKHIGSIGNHVVSLNRRKVVSVIVKTLLWNNEI